MTAVMDRPAVSESSKVQRQCHPQKVRLGDIVPSPRGQREFDPNWAAQLAADFDLEGMGHITLNKRAGVYYCCDGQHRIAALKLLGFAPYDPVPDCDVYEGLTESEEADLFLKLNHHKNVTAFDKFKVGVHAEREEETAIRRYVMAQGLSISRSGGISCVTSLRRAYRRQGAGGFSKTLRVIRDAYGDAGFTMHVVDGVSIFLHRYDGQVDEVQAIAQLGSMHGGVSGLLGLAKKERVSTNAPLVQCIAAVCTTVYNRSRGKKLVPWWRE